MHRTLLAIILLWQGVHSISLSCDTGCQQEQRQALVDLYNALSGSNWRNNQGWLSEHQPYCTWQGVLCCDTTMSPQCDRSHIVMELHMDTNNASGTIPDSVLQKLSRGLTYLDVRYVSASLAGSSTPAFSWHPAPQPKAKSPVPSILA
jgi:hypothetical protein